MALGILSSDKFKEELNRFAVATQDKSNARASQNNSEPEIQEKEISRGRNNAEEVPSPIRKLIAQELIAGASIKEVTSTFGISQASASAYKNGATSTATYHKPNDDLQEANNRFRDTIKNLASDRLIDAINAITNEKLQDSKVNVASAVARDMSQIVKNISPELNEQGTKNQVIIYKPRMKDEDDFQILDVQKLD